MSILPWTLLALTTLTALSLAAVTASSHRQRLAATVAMAGLGALLMVAGADVVALAWLVVMVPLGACRPTADDDKAQHAGARRLPAGVLTAGLAAAVYLLTQQMAWHGLPADAAQPQTAALVGRLLRTDTTVVMALVLAVVAVLTAGREVQS